MAVLRRYGDSLLNLQNSSGMRWSSAYAARLPRRQFRNQDLFAADIRKATVVMLYL